MSSPDQIRHFLSLTHICQHLKPSQMDSLLQKVSIQKMAMNTCLFEEGDAGDAWYLIVEGEVSLSKRYLNGSNHELTVLSSGDAFGEMSLIDDAPRSATAMVNMDSTLVKLPKETFLEMIEAEDPVALKLMWVMARDLSQLSKELTQILTDLVEDTHVELEPHNEMLEQMLRYQLGLGQ